MTAAPCAGMWDLFDSTDYYDHRRARQICAECPLIDACRTNLADARASAFTAQHGPRGTWAGELVGGELHNPHRLAAEEAMFTDDEARACHTAWTRAGRRGRPLLSDRVALGERVYQRRAKRGEYRYFKVGEDAA